MVLIEKSTLETLEETSIRIIEPTHVTIIAVKTPSRMFVDFIFFSETYYLLASQKYLFIK